MPPQPDWGLCLLGLPLITTSNSQYQHLPNDSSLTRYFQIQHIKSLARFRASSSYPTPQSTFLLLLANRHGPILALPVSRIPSDQLRIKSHLHPPTWNPHPATSSHLTISCIRMAQPDSAHPAQPNQNNRKSYRAIITQSPHPIISPLALPYYYSWPLQAYSLVDTPSRMMMRLQSMSPN